MNSITIAGNLGKDAEMRYTGSGDPVANFSVADNQSKDKPPIWWACSLFGKRAESLAAYLVKGQQVTVVGNITEREYTDRDGNKRKAQDVRVQEIALQGSRSDERQEARQEAKPRAAPKPEAKSFEEMEDDIPF